MLGCVPLLQTDINIMLIIIQKKITITPAPFLRTPNNARPLSDIHHPHSARTCPTRVGGLRVSGLRRSEPAEPGQSGAAVPEEGGR